MNQVGPSTSVTLMVIQSWSAPVPAGGCLLDAWLCAEQTPVPTSGLGKGGASEAVPARVGLWLIFVLAGGLPAFHRVSERRTRRAFDRGLPRGQAMTLGGLAVARTRRGGETVVSFTTGAGRGRRGAVLAVVAAMVGLVVAALPAASAVAATSQTLVPWGDLGTMQQGVPTGLSDVAAIAAGSGDHGLVLKGDGTVLAWGAWREGQTAVPAGLDHVVAISAGLVHSLALKDDGTVVAWGANNHGQTDVPAGLNNAVAISAGEYHNLAVRGDGTVIGWGENAHGETQPPAGLSNVTAVAAGAGHSLALKSDGTVVAWGANNAGQATVPAGLDQVVAVAASGASGESGFTSNGYSLALKSDGTVVAWGANNHGQTDVPAGLDQVTALAAGWGYVLALKSDGTVVAWGDPFYGHTNVPEGLDHVTAIAAGGSDSIALVSGASAPLTTIACKYLTACSTAWDGTQPTTGWYGSFPVDVFLRAYATAGSGVAKTVYTLDGSDPATSPTAITYTHPPDTLTAFVQLPDLTSTTTVRFFSVDAAGHVEPTRSELIQVDLVPPTTTITCNTAACSSGWYAAPVTMALSASDAGGSGVATTLYTTDGTDPRFSATALTYTGPFTVAQTTTVKYSSKDIAGNTEPPKYGDPQPPKTQQVQIDTTAPTTSIACNGQPCSTTAYSSAVTVSLAASDRGGSGLASTVYTTDDTDPTTSPTAKTYTGPFTVSSTATVRYNSTDTAGNIEPGQSQLIQISKPPTTGSVVLTPTDDAYTAKGDPAAPHGAEEVLKVNSGARERRTYMRFSLAAIPAGATGITASLRLYTSSDASASVRFTVSQVATGWSEATLTWNTQPAVGTTVGSKAGVVGGAYNSVEVSGLVGGSGTYAMVVTDNSTAQRSFASKESSLNKPPQLVVSWTNPG
jgi:hypothetical protein